MKKNKGFGQGNLRPIFYEIYHFIFLYELKTETNPSFVQGVYAHWFINDIFLSQNFWR